MRIRKLLLALLTVCMLTSMMPPALMAIYSDDDTLGIDDLFPDPAFQDYVSFVLDLNGDGCLSDREINAVEEIDVSYLDIESLEGIELFTQLKSLNCAYNALTSLDVRNNTQLETLNCAGNALRALDLRKNTALQTLICDGNQLTALNLTKNSALYTLDCGANRLKGLDLSANTRLTFLYCAYNQLDELDISNCPALAKLTDTTEPVEDDDCVRYEKNDIVYMMADYGTELVGSGSGGVLIDSVNFPDPIFRRYVEDNLDTDEDGVLSDDEALAVESIDVSGLGIATLAGLECFPELTSLNCENNALEDLDIGANTELATLICGDNLLAELDISRCPSLVTLQDTVDPVYSEGHEIYEDGDDTLSFDMDVDLITEHEPLIPIDEENFPDDTFRAWVARKIDADEDGCLSAEEISATKSIDISNMGIDELGGIELFTALTHLNCSDNTLRSLDLDAFPNLKSLNCSGNELIWLDLGDKSKLESLYCEENAIATLDISGCPKLVKIAVRKNLKVNTGFAEYLNGYVIALACDRNVILETGKAPANLNTLTLPKSLTTIEADAFSGSAVQAVVIPDGCETVGARAFADCTLLEKVTIPGSVDSIASDAFEGCAGLTIVTDSDKISSWAEFNGWQVE